MKHRCTSVSYTHLDVYKRQMKTYPHLLESTGITIEKNPKRTKDDQNGPRGLFGFAGLLCPWNHKRKKESHHHRDLFHLWSPWPFSSGVFQEGDWWIERTEQAKKKSPVKASDILKRPFMITVCCGKRKKAPHVCSCRAFLRRNSCRAASLLSLIHI